MTLETADGTRHKFRVPDREIPHVAEALRGIAGDRFREPPSRGLSGGEVAAILVGLAALAALVSAWLLSLPALAVAGVLVLLLAAAIPLALVRDKRNSDAQPGGAPRKKPRRRKGNDEAAV